VGRTPISLALPNDMSMSQLDATLAWMTKTSDEVERLSGEFEAFKRDVQ
jgi:hypothetical protein